MRKFKPTARDYIAVTRRRRTRTKMFGNWIGPAVFRSSSPTSLSRSKISLLEKIAVIHITGIKHCAGASVATEEQMKEEVELTDRIWSKRPR